MKPAMTQHKRRIVGEILADIEGTELERFASY